MFDLAKSIFWAMPGLSRREKEKIFFELRKIVKRDNQKLDKNNMEDILLRYRDQILNVPTMRAKAYRELNLTSFNRQKSDLKLFAFYLTQYTPTKENDEWWGKGVTEWNNVCRAVPEFLGHYQPRLPGELGFYDLRVKDNLARQAELAKLYGIYGFCFYYYWFDGRRLLEKPLDLFFNNKDIDLPFCLCWANESWKSTFSSGSADTILVEQRHTVESYKNFIKDFVKYLEDDRYYTINGKKVIVVYKPQDIPEPQEVLGYWRDYCLKHGYGDIYLIGVWLAQEPYNVIDMGFDAAVEFQAASLLEYIRDQKINDKLDFVGEDYTANIYSYRDLVNHEVYRKNYNKEKLIHSIFPMWDNTARRNNHGALIFHDSTPDLYKKWLKELIKDNFQRTDIDDNVAFLNSWNEWGEGSYIEPDKYWGYAYLQANREAIEECRKIVFEGTKKEF
ncbi:glycoside hydrolase family 99-like domain-containing protein [Acidaminococcus timonensis]|jgi:lipopolysaccharide biosynthesis protein|uniref:glycoside hydrolase family 99-like domain-containing protein n=1 Tax=Acidaminococcus timonensis TaxID=1871002 RepID=UPI003A5C5F7D